MIKSFATFDMKRCVHPCETALELDSAVLRLPPALLRLAPYPLPHLISVIHVRLVAKRDALPKITQHTLARDGRARGPIETLEMVEKEVDFPAFGGLGQRQKFEPRAIVTCKGGVRPARDCPGHHRHPQARFCAVKHPKGIEIDAFPTISSTEPLGFLPLKVL